MRGLTVLMLLGATPAMAHITRYENATIFGSDARAFVVEDGRFSDTSAPPDAVVDLRGGFVVPYLADAHGHLLSLGRSLETVDLTGTASFDEVLARVKRDASASGWVFGRGWDQNDWPDKAFPAHAALTAAFPTRPVVLTRIDGHAYLANAAALRAAGIDRTTADPPGGRILRDPSGEPTGVLVDAAMERLDHAIPPLARADRERMLLAAMDRAVAVGLTSVHDMGVEEETYRALVELDRRGEVPLRVAVYLERPFAGAAPLVTGRVALVGVKLFADGALGSRGAALLAAYSDEPGNVGLLQHSPTELLERCREAATAGFHVAIHAIGDRGVRTALDALAACHPPVGRVEHAQVVALTDLARFAAEHAVASMQPTHATSDMPWAEARVGEERLRGAYAWRKMLASGATLVFGSDFPIESIDPRKGLYAAVTRMDEAGRPPGGWTPGEVVTMDEALTAFSRAAARVVGFEPARYADFTVFDRDLRTLAPKDVLTARIAHVVVGGIDVTRKVRSPRP